MIFIFTKNILKFTLHLELLILYVFILGAKKLKLLGNTVG